MRIPIFICLFVSICCGILLTNAQQYFGTDWIGDRETHHPVGTDWIGDRDTDYKPHPLSPKPRRYSGGVMGSSRDSGGRMRGGRTGSRRRGMGRYASCGLSGDTCIRDNECCSYFCNRIGGRGCA